MSSTFHAGCVRELEATFGLRHICLDPQWCGGAAPAQDPGRAARGRAAHGRAARGRAARGRAAQLNAAIHESGRQLTFMHAHCLFGQTDYQLAIRLWN